MMKHYFVNTVRFTNPAIKILSKGSSPESEFDIAFRDDKKCEMNEKNPYIPGTTICQNCYSRALGDKMEELRKSKRSDFIIYQLAQQTDKNQWLKELNDFVLDNEKYLNQSDYSASSDFRNTISRLRNTTRSATPNFSDTTSLLADFLKAMPTPSSSIPSVSTSVQVPSTPTAAPATTINPVLKWTRFDVDLLEFVTALHKSGAINNSSGNLSRTEAIEFFEKLFGIKIKDAESKLSKATGRKRSRHPFLDELVKTFADYCDKKDALNPQAEE